MLQRLRWWLVRKLIGRSSVLANAYLEINGKDVEICLGPGLIFGNHFAGDWPTALDGEGKAHRFMSRSLALKLDV